jgi:hypothetical protein
MISNLMDRRSFLLTVVGSILVAKELFSVELTNALEQFPDDKISVFVQLAKDVIATKNVLAVHDQACIRLLDHISHFEPGSVTHYEFDEAQENATSLFAKAASLDIAALEQLVDGLVPIRVLMSLMKTYQIKFGFLTKPGVENPEWDDFSNRFRHIIIND